MTNRELQLLQKQKMMYSSLTDEQLKVINEYFADNMKELKKICDPLIVQKNVPEIYYEDLYGVASDTLIESLVSYNETKSCSFKTYLIGNIKRTFYDWTRDKWRGKRCNVERDEKGRIKRDEKGNPIIIHDISLDVLVEDGISLFEKIASDFNIYDEISVEIGISSGSKMEKYLEQLSRIQRQVAMYLSEGYKPTEIREILHITEKEYNDCMMAIKAYKNISILF